MSSQTYARARLALVRRPDWGWLLAGGLTAYVAIYVAWLMLGNGDQDTRTHISDVAVVPVGLISTVLALRASRQSRLDERVRRAWRRLAIGFAAFALGDLAWCLIEIVFDGDPFPSVSDIGYIAFYPLVLWGLLSFPMALRTRNDRLKFWLDALIVVVGAGAAIWYFVFLPVLRQTQDDPFAVAVALAYPVGDLLLLLGLATVLLRRPGGGTAGALRILASGLALMLVSDAAFGPLVLQDAHEGGSWVDITWTVASLLMAIGAQVQAWRGQHDGAAAVGGETGARPFSSIPYVAVGIGQGLLVIAALGEWDQALGGLLAASIVVTALVVLRQIVAVRENARLLAEQAERRDALLQLAHRFGAQVIPSALEREVLRAAVDLVGGDNAETATWNADRQELDARHRLHESAPPATRATVAQACLDAVNTGEAIIATSTASADGTPQSASPVHSIAALAVPIACDGHLFGVLAVSDSRPHARYTDDDAEILALLAGLAAARTLGGERARLEGALLAARTAEHELNNQLTGAAGFSELLATDEDLPEHLRELAEAALAKLAADLAKAPFTHSGSIGGNRPTLRTLS